MKEYKYPWTVGSAIRKALIGWMFAACMCYVQIPASLRSLRTTEGYQYINGGAALFLGVAVFALLMVYPVLTKERVRVERWLLFWLFFLLSSLSLVYSFSVPFLACLLVVSIFFVLYTENGWQEDTRHPSPTMPASPIARKMVVLLGIGLFLFISGWMVFRVKTHSCPAYDFGIFVQMFHSMKTHGTMMTTIERTEAMSHMCIHVSPIYYLMLPFYAIVSTPETLQVLQAAVLASALIPLWKLARWHGLDGWESMLICALLVFYPAYAGGTSYDLHENVFLPPLLLWMLYFLQKKQAVGTMVFAVLTLLVKEDAAVYVAIIALWVLVDGMLNRTARRWKLIFGTTLLVVAVVYFLGVTWWLQMYGDGVMVGRYNNFLFGGGDSLFVVIQAVLMEPMRVFFEAMDVEKLAYIGLTLGCLGGWPLFTRRYERFILLIPYVLLNLMPDYEYQHSVMFQYGYGATACLFFLLVLNVSDMRKRVKLPALRYGWLFLPMLFSMVMFSWQIVPKATTYVERYVDYEDIFRAREAILDRIPAEASVSASTFFLVPLADRDDLYDIKHSKIEDVFSTEYILADPGETACYERFMSLENLDGYEAFEECLRQHGYVHCIFSGAGLEVFQKAE